MLVNKNDDREEIPVFQKGTPSEETEIKYDDSYVDKADKLKLLEVIESELSEDPEFKWADAIMKKCLITYRYKKVMQNLNKEQYLNEKQKLNENILNVLD